MERKHMIRIVEGVLKEFATTQPNLSAPSARHIISCRIVEELFMPEPVEPTFYKRREAKK